MSELVKNRPPQQEVFPSVTREHLRRNPDAKEVADELGLHISTVYRHAKGMDLKMIRSFKTLELDTRDMIIFMHRYGVPVSKRAEILGVTVSYASQVMSEVLKKEALPDYENPDHIPKWVWDNV